MEHICLFRWRLRPKVPSRKWTLTLASQSVLGQISGFLSPLRAARWDPLQDPAHYATSIGWEVKHLGFQAFAPQPCDCTNLNAHLLRPCGLDASRWDASWVHVARLVKGHDV